MYRRDFLVRTGQAIGVAALASAVRTAEVLAKTPRRAELKFARELLQQSRELLDRMQGG